MIHQSLPDMLGVPADKFNVFADVVAFSLNTPDLVEQYDRLMGTNVSMRGSPLDLAIDIETGRWASETIAYARFVKECIWDRCDVKVIEELVENEKQLKRNISH